MDDDPFHRRPPLSPFLEEVRRPREPVSGATTLLQILIALTGLILPAGIFFAFKLEMVRGGLFGPIWAVIVLAVPSVGLIAWALYRWLR
ncbi:conserved protein of unknown function [Bradyrhizobium sp. ORS 285]|uniref:hypothetical protein n=1 Tax=Bradyrhizobium sp. ORS 285 TaxID=115808 RepID=UPI0002405C18|nr:hypothetical protein [Bradyrhizobium sp. ORS 285]CCD86551.1 conserved hypothetical protein [Bradyrhizobium sp. ORS 285]SMX62132.1 conserved protein of unknown function [Bradyrhizobium sp. ORS 285]